ncbi:hypothetical protein UFOVP760_85 [uncultured Caudovirales phage]|uniref:Uncharacterized protein n=1 Tax=uncultured Caudovirales phage TaxID=2100421 RepID=A0A6J7X6P2_9CAUD|nr:hypothetical protein UFOVP760_85 [uncultured Caudovirales phage]
MTEREIAEIDLSITFGQRLIKYKKASLERMLSSMIDNNEKIRQHYESDRDYIRDIILALESGDVITFMPLLKQRLTIVGQMFFKNEFKALKMLASS